MDLLKPSHEAGRGQPEIRHAGKAGVERGGGEVWAPLPLTLNEARAADAFVILWGEYGGSTYLIAAAGDVRCTHDGLG